MNKKAIMWVGIECLVACVVFGVAFLVLGGTFVNWVMQEPENITVDVLAPITVSKSEDFILEVLITNTASKEQEINSIDIDTSYLDGLAVINTTPKYTETFANNMLGQSFQSYYFTYAVPANETTIVKFHMTALKSGDYSGEIAICINSGSNCTEHYLRTLVE